MSSVTTTEQKKMDVHVLKFDQIEFQETCAADHPAEDLRWLRILRNGLKHVPYLLRAQRDGTPVGELPLVLVSGPIFGKFLVGLSYLNSGGVKSNDRHAAECLIERAAELADELGCRYLELRHEVPIPHSRFNAELTSKVHMRLTLPGTVEELRNSLKAKVRNQVKKGESQGFTVQWGTHSLINEFYKVFAIRMRELGTPVFSRQLFVSILNELPDMAEICCVQDGKQTIAAALLIHGRTVTEVPSASSISEFNRTNANMLLYWNLLSRSVERGQGVFDFGRSTLDGPTYKFKKQWGAEAFPAHWQYYLRVGSVDEMRPDSGKKKFLIEAWKHLPVWFTKLIGPTIVRGIP